MWIRWYQNRESRVFRYRNGVKALESAFKLWQGKLTELRRAHSCLLDEANARATRNTFGALDQYTQQLLTKHSYHLLRARLAQTQKFYGILRHEHNALRQRAGQLICKSRVALKKQALSHLRGETQVAKAMSHLD